MHREVSEVKDLRDWFTVNQLHQKGVPIKQIARTLGMSRNTVKRLIKLEEPPKYERTVTVTKVDKFKDMIRMWYLDDNYRFNGTRIYNELCKLGYEGSLTPIYGYLEVLDGEKTTISKKATQRTETPPGDQAQYDWSPYEMNIGNAKITVYCFSMILSYSRKKAILFSKSVDGISIYESIQDLFIELGGTTKELVIDNPKALVNHHKSDDEVEYNDNALRMLSHLKTQPNACKPRRARTKGKVENPFKYIEEQFVKGNSFSSIEELNDAAKDFIAEFNNRIHSTTGRKPVDMYDEEKDLLQKINKKIVLDVDIYERKVSPDSYVSMDTNRYSVPVKYVDKLVKVRKIYGYLIQIFDLDKNLIREYPLLEGRKEAVTTPDDYKEIANKTPFSIPEIKRVFEKTFKHGSEFYSLASRITTQPHFHARELLKLQEVYDTNDLDIILKHCIENNILKIDGIKTVLKEKFLNLMIEHETLGLKERERLEGQINHNNEGVTRSLSYYEQGGH